jgi:hypothetical protein
MFFSEIIADCFDKLNKNVNTHCGQMQRFLMLSEVVHIVHVFIYSGTSNNGHCRGIQILSVIGGVR